jgi:hypothetical protein
VGTGRRLLFFELALQALAAVTGRLKTSEALLDESKMSLPAAVAGSRKVCRCVLLSVGVFGVGGMPNVFG